MTETRIMVASSTLWPLLMGEKGGHDRFVRVLQRLGFEGIEYLFTKQFLCEYFRLIPTLEAAGIEVTGHLWWTEARSAQILRFLGIFPERSRFPADYPLPAIPTVVSSYQNDWWPHVMNPVYQLVSGSSTYEGQVELIKKENRRVVFDVMHTLEYYLRHLIESGQVLPTLHDLLSTAKNLFNQLQQYVDELHVYGFSLDKESRRFDNMNQIPTRSTFPILDFIAWVIQRGWKGRIVWEIDPRVAFQMYFRGRLTSSLKETVALTRLAIGQAP